MSGSIKTGVKTSREFREESYLVLYIREEKLIV
jgi:hypothetical protein